MNYRDVFDRVWGQRQDGSWSQVGGPGFDLAELHEEFGPMTLLPSDTAGASDMVRAIVREEIAASLSRIHDDADFWTSDGDTRGDINYEIRERLDGEIRRLTGGLS